MEETSEIEFKILNKCVNGDQEDLISLLNNTIDHLKKENQQFSELFQDLNISKDNFDTKTKESLNKLTNIQCLLGTATMDETCVINAALNKQLNNFRLNKTNVKLEKMLKNVTKENERNKHLIHRLNKFLEMGNNENLKDIEKESLDVEAKLEKTKEMVELQKHKFKDYNDPKYNISEINENIKSINELKETKLKLEEKLRKYGGMSSDISEAKEQLRRQKEIYNNILSQLNR